MMKKGALITLLCVAAAIILCACGKQGKKASGFDCEEAYKPTLEEFYEVIASPESNEDLHDGLNGVREAALAFGDGALDKIGYLFDDVNGDGREEVFIGCFDNEGADGVKNEIYAAFSHDGNDLIPLFEKQKRSTFALTGEGTFYFYGTDGAKYYILAEYELTEDGELSCIDFYFTYPRNGDGKNFGYYHNTTGEWDPEGSEEISLTPEAFDKLRSGIAKRTKPLEDVRFSEVGE